MLVLQRFWRVKPRGWDPTVNKQAWNKNGLLPGGCIQWMMMQSRPSLQLHWCSNQQFWLPGFGICWGMVQVWVGNRSFSTPVNERHRVLLIWWILLSQYLLTGWYQNPCVFYVMTSIRIWLVDWYCLRGTGNGKLFSVHMSSDWRGILSHFTVVVYLPNALQTFPAVLHYHPSIVSWAFLKKCWWIYAA